MNDAFLYSKNDAPVVDIEEWAILMAYSERADDDGCNAWQSHPTIAKRAHISAKTVGRRVKDMIERGLLKKGDQRAVEHIEFWQRPVVYDIQIPYSWFPNIDRINEYRSRLGRAPLTPEDRPDLAPAPEPKRRKDAGVKRKNSTTIDDEDQTVNAPLDYKSGTQGLVVQGGGGLQVPGSDEGKSGVTPGLVVQTWTTSPTTLGVTHRDSLTSRTSPSPSGGEDFSDLTEEEKNDQFPKGENQESGYAADGYPLDVTAWESNLISELDALRPDWGPRLIRIAVGHPSVRARTASNAGLVRRAFLLAAADKLRPGERRRGTWTPKRLIADGCPLWSQALADMEAEALAELGRGQPDFADAAQTVPAARAPLPDTTVVPLEKRGPSAEYLASRARLDAKLDERRSSASA